jgi:hypothetical protein
MCALKEKATMPQSIPSGLTREHVLRALADLDAGSDNPFGPATGYDLLHDGKRYAPKAAVGLACVYLLGRPLRPDEFSGGEAPGQANFVLRKLGFTVVKKGELLDEEEKPARVDWSQEEVRLIVADYFTMLEQELLGKAYNKTEHRKALSLNLTRRSDGSIEFKHANISAVLAGQGLPYIEGYKPRGNYQNLLSTEVEAFLDAHSEFLAQLADAPSLNPVQPPRADQLDLDAVIEAPPDQILAPEAAGRPWLSRKGRRIDFAERDAANRQLGKMGEQFVMALEQHRLREVGRDDLAGKVQWVAETIGDGLGFDVLSFDDADDSERLIEVKTTGLGKFFPFYVTATEVRCSEDMAERFHLFRVFDFSQSPRAYVLPGSLLGWCRLEPTLFRASIE